jgi:hypothetical protein
MHDVVSDSLISNQTKLKPNNVVFSMGESTYTIYALEPSSMLKLTRSNSWVWCNTQWDLV